MRSLPILLASLALVAQAHAEGLSAERRAALRELVVEDCGACHGARLKGGLGPALLPQRLASFPDEFLVRTILDGRPGTPMPPWRDYLTRDEARWIVQQLKQGNLTARP